ncbi:alpha/beta hydrolase [Brevundimonas sp.]|uniref:alpha/beta hydrolase n=1 Tax=Brevundimonas sp. TaxID=1871086 RepID=UPI0025B8AF7C|nr:alpha/beta hydrolase [Brevundimonas sp.]
MTLRTHTVDFPAPQLAAQRRLNALLNRAPRFRTDPWRVEAGQQLSVWLEAAAAAVTTPRLKKRGVTVEIVHTDGDHPVHLRILRPSGTPRAIVLDIHGGGWVLGGASLNDRLNGYLAHNGYCVVSVDYRLLSERRHVYIDAAIADCLAAAYWTVTNVDRLGASSLFILGESAGGHLAALTALALRDQGLIDLVKGCVLAYGVYDLSGTDSVRAAGPQVLLFNGPTMRADLARLAPDRDEAGLRQPDVSPLYADPTGLPPALFLAGELDPLFDDSLLMAGRWGRIADVDLIRVPETPHGFLHFGGPAARGASTAILRWLDARLSRNLDVAGE